METFYTLEIKLRAMYSAAPYSFQTEDHSYWYSRVFTPRSYFCMPVYI